MSSQNYILQYYQKIKDGSICVGKWIEKFYEYLVVGLQQKQFIFDPKKATNVIKWIEEHCYHTEGPLAPKQLKLELWQKAIVSVIYGIVDSKGKRQFREVVLIMARKNGKSLFASSIVKYEWQQGGYGARVYCLAPKLDQTDIIYNSVWQQTTLDPEYQELKDAVKAGIKYHERKTVDDSALPKHRMTDLYIASQNATVKKISFDNKRSDGFNPSLTVCDEIASWVGDKGLKMYEVMKSAMGAREMGDNPSLILSCSTAGYIEGGIYDELLKRATRFLNGESKEKRLAPFLYIIDDVDKWADINELQKSNPNLGVSVSVDYLLDEITIAEGSLSKKAEFIVKYACVKQNSSLAWLDAKTINKCCGEHMDLESFRNSYAVCGIDLSQTTDLTAAVVIIQKHEDLYVFAKFFLPGAKIQEATERDGLPYAAYVNRGLLIPSGENFVDYADCYEWLVSLIEKYEIYPLMVGYDRYSSQYLIKDLETYGFKTDDVFQGTNLYPVLMETEGMMKDGRIHIGDNDLLKIHMLNSAIKMDVEQNRGKLVKISPKEHIDGMAAFADAMTVRQKHWADLGDRLINEE